MHKYGSIPDNKIICALIWIAALCMMSGTVSAWQQYPYSVNPYSYMSPYGNNGSWYPQGMNGFSPWDRRQFNSYMNRPSPGWKVRGGMDERGNIWFVMEYKGNIYTGGYTNWYSPGNVGNW